MEVAGTHEAVIPPVPSREELLQADVKIAVAGMANDRPWYKACGEVLLRFGDAFGQPRNRHAYICRPELRAVAQRLIGVDYVWRARQSLWRSSGLVVQEKSSRAAGPTDSTGRGRVITVLLCSA